MHYYLCQKSEGNWINGSKIIGGRLRDTDSLSYHLECLKLCGSQTENEKKILESLNVILLALDEDKQRTPILLKDSGVLSVLAQILRDHARCAEKVAHVLAELAKNEEMRKPCIDAGLVLALLPLLESTNQETLLHAGRAIGRICYENNAAKEALSKTKVSEQLVKQLKRAEIQEKLEVITEVLQMLSENDALKLQLVEAGVQETLCAILLSYEDSSKTENIGSMKGATDLIISLLLGDESMQKLFDNGCGIVYQNIPAWLSSKHTQLQMAGALAIANFARNDSNCIQMVQLGVVHQLLDLLEQHVENGDVSVQHAALSALRNLAIPVMNKVQMLEEGVTDRIQMLLRSEMPPVQFKLLGTLRMITDGQADAAKVLGQDPIFLNRLVQWCEAKDHAGVCGEANRLLASLLRHSKSQEVVKTIQQAQGVKHLVSMTTSEHAIMQNEALIALAIASAINLDAVEESFKESELVPVLHKLLSCGTMGPEVKYNSVGLLCNLLNSDDLRHQVEESNVKETLEKLCSHSNASVVKQAVMALQILRNGRQHRSHFFA
ncbi:rap1 GTPase-GDP dissociation stimulator 1-like [Rhinatrema bivittatum]|uniref:rap1 GTPase-GDP dissociation stimulator 1-like n=1 Tax=Rhinatrema bivittatum TaxID=194408 RepID=UPI00112AC284|nr:rap1 GTPase-GDP dissociation stimulator 1-like [Rhinatrema bivittatum]